MRQLSGWAEQTTNAFRLEVVDGDHWLLDGGGTALMRIARRAPPMSGLTEELRARAAEQPMAPASELPWPV